MPDRKLTPPQPSKRMILDKRRFAMRPGLCAPKSILRSSIRRSTTRMTQRHARRKSRVRWPKRRGCLARRNTRRPKASHASYWRHRPARRKDGSFWRARCLPKAKRMKPNASSSNLPANVFRYLPRWPGQTLAWAKLRCSADRARKPPAISRTQCAPTPSTLRP